MLTDAVMFDIDGTLRVARVMFVSDDHGRLRIRWAVRR
jgi:hypothetical protein